MKKDQNGKKWSLEKFVAYFTVPTMLLALIFCIATVTIPTFPKLLFPISFGASLSISMVVGIVDSIIKEINEKKEQELKEQELDKLEKKVVEKELNIIKENSKEIKKEKVCPAVQAVKKMLEEEPEPGQE